MPKNPTEQTELWKTVEQGLWGQLWNQVQAILEAVRDNQPVDHPAVTSALRVFHQLREQHDGECLWTWQGHPMNGYWRAGCGNDEGSGMVGIPPFCYFCGKRVREARDGR